MTEPKAPVAWRSRRKKEAEGCAQVHGFKAEPLALQSDYVAAVERAEKAEAKLSDLRAAVQQALGWKTVKELWDIPSVLRAAIAQVRP